MNEWGYDENLPVFAVLHDGPWALAGWHVEGCGVIDVGLGSELVAAITVNDAVSDDHRANLAALEAGYGWSCFRVYVHGVVPLTRAAREMVGQ